MRVRQQLHNRVQNQPHAHKERSVFLGTATFGDDLLSFETVFKFAKIGLAEKSRLCYQNVIHI